MKFSQKVCFLVGKILWFWQIILTLCAMRKVLLGALLLFPVLTIFAQNNRAILKEIDSISQKRWSIMQPNLDSLEIITSELLAK